MSIPQSCHYKYLLHKYLLGNFNENILLQEMFLKYNLKKWWVNSTWRVSRPYHTRPGKQWCSQAWPKTLLADSPGQGPAHYHHHGSYDFSVELTPHANLVYSICPSAVTWTWQDLHASQNHRWTERFLSSLHSILLLLLLLLLFSYLPRFAGPALQLR